MYLLVHLLCSHGFALYRINDPLEYNSPLLNDLRPLLVFPSTDGQPDYFNCIKLESRFYVFGLNHCFGAEGTDKERLLRIVYTIDEEQLLRIEPSEHNDINKFKELLIPTENPMHGSKYVPTLFVANRKLYVLSRDFEDSMFEVFDPCGQTWHMLQPCPFVKPRSYDAVDTYNCISIYVLLLFYFPTSITVFSFTIYRLSGSGPLSGPLYLG